MSLTYDPFSTLKSSQQPPFQLDLFRKLDHVQSNHGIPHQDYAQYMSYCSNRLKRLRHLKDVKVDLVHSPHYAIKAAVTAAVSQAQAATTDSAATTESGTTTTTTNTPTIADLKKMPRNAYCPREQPTAAASLPLSFHHEAMIWDSIFQAERAWAQACDLQQKEKESSAASAAAAASQKPKRSCHGWVLRRLHKAEKHMKDLLERLDIAASTNAATGAAAAAVLTRESVLECQSYAAWMAANAALEQKDYLKASLQYKQAVEVLQELIQNHSTTTTTGGDSSNKAASVAIWTTRAETLLTPLLRFCVYHVKESEYPNPSSLLSFMTTTTTTASKKQSSSMTFSFRGRDISLDDYKELAVLYLKIEQAMKQQQQRRRRLEQEKKESDDEDDAEEEESQFLQLSNDLDDALRLVANATAAAGGVGGGEETGKHQRQQHELKLLAAYFESQKLYLWRLHQELIVLPKLLSSSSSSKTSSVAESVAVSDAEIVHVYDQLLQTANKHANLLTTTTSDAADENEEDDEDDPYWLTAQAHVVRLRALRCFYVARWYSSAEDETSASLSPSQLLSLVKHAQKLNKRAQEEMAACAEDHNNDDDDEVDNDENKLFGAEDFEAYIEHLKVVVDELETIRCRVEATRYLNKQSEQQQEVAQDVVVNVCKTNRPLWLRLDDLDAGSLSSLVDVAAPTLQPIPIPCKPVFYDIAWQHISSQQNGGLDVISNFIQQNDPDAKKKASSSGGGLLSWIF